MQAAPSERESEEVRERTSLDAALEGLDPASLYLLKASLLRELSDEYIAEVLSTNVESVRARRDWALDRLSADSPSSRTMIVRALRGDPEPLPLRAKSVEVRPGAKLAWGAAAVGLSLAVGIAASVRGSVGLLIVAALLGAVLIGMRPGLGAACLPVLIFFESVVPSIVAAAVLSAALILLGFRYVRLRPTPPLAWASAFAIWGFASALWTVNLSISSTQFAGLAFAVCILFAVPILINSDRDLRTFVYVFVLLAAATGIQGIFSVATGSVSRAESFVGDPNIFAMYQLIALPLAFVLAADSPRRWIRFWAYGAMLVSLAAVFTSLSRGGLIALGVVVALLLIAPVSTLYRSRRHKLVLIAVVMVAAIAALFTLSGELSSRLSEKNTATGSGRVNEWRAALSAFQDHPAVGLGLGGFFVESNDLLRTTPGVDLRDFRLEKAGQRVHNAYIDAAAELGVVGLFLFLGMLISTILALRRIRWHAAGLARNFRADVAAALVIGLVGFAVASLFLSTDLSFALFMMVGLTVALEEPWRTQADA